MAHLSASIGSCKRAIIFRRRSITLSIFANFPLCGRVISTRRPPLSPGPAGRPSRRPSAFQAGISNHPFRHRICQPTCNQPFRYYSYLQPAMPACPPAPPLCSTSSCPHPDEPLVSPIPPSRSTSLIQTTAAHIFDAIRPPVQSMRCWTDTLFPQDSKSAS